MYIIFCELPKIFIVCLLTVFLSVTTLSSSAFAAYQDRSGELPGMDGGNGAKQALTIAGISAVIYFIVYMVKKGNKTNKNIVK